MGQVTDLQSVARQRAIDTVQIKLGIGTAGLDPYDRDVLILEVDDPARPEPRLLGQVVAVHPFVRHDASRCYRIRLVPDDEARELLGLDSDRPPVMRDTAHASRTYRERARQDIEERDRSRRAGRSWT